MDEDRDEEMEEGAQARRPKVVDKRISAGGHHERAKPAEPPPQPPPADAAAPGPPSEQPPIGQPATPQPPPSAGPPPGAAPPGPETWTPEQRAQAEQMAREIVETPGLDWVVNVAINLANVAGAKLELGAPPADAQLVIDALASIVGSLEGRLGEAEAPLKQTVAQLQLAYAQAVASPPSSR